MTCSSINFAHRTAYLSEEAERTCAPETRPEVQALHRTQKESGSLSARVLQHSQLPVVRRQLKDVSAGVRFSL
jgi:hypothetical protein